MARIEELLNRRSDMSTFLVHLTREGRGRSPMENLLAMLMERRIVAGTEAFGPARSHEARLAPKGQTQRVVCFTETPLEHIWVLLEDIDSRRLTFAPYGVITTKTAGRKRGCNPVWYTDMTPRRGREWLSQPINRLVDAAVERHPNDDEALSAEEIFALTPFIEQMGPMNNGGRKEFWWEREWRHRGDYSLEADEVVALLVPEGDHADVRRQLVSSLGHSSVWLDRALLDPTWGLERMIVALAGVDAAVVGPFPRR